MTRIPLLVALLAMCFVLGGTAGGAAAYGMLFDFNTSWNTDYAPGWENSAYRHGPAPVGRMMEWVNGGMRLIAESTPQSSMWWAAVNPVAVHSPYMAKQFDPWVSVDYFDEGWEAGTLHRAGQLYAVPSWVNPYLTGGEDWTDVQFGARMNQSDNYYYVAAGQGSPGWQNTGAARAPGWVNLKMQLSSNDGKIHFYLDNFEVGSSYRSDYADLVGIGLYTMFTAPLSSWGDNKPSVLYDNFQFGSTAVPEPATLVLVGAGLTALGIRRRRRK